MINGAILRDAVISAANNVANHRQEIDALNVFPVPDGDTGTNMGMTMASAARELARVPDDETVAKVANITSSAMLRGARGNSGVILSLIFRGIAKGLKGLDEIGPRELVVALSYGVESSYKAVMKPTEGTILTVVRLAARAGAEFASENKEADIVPVWEAIIKGAEDALATTPDLLPVLKKAGVIDAGGRGLIYAFEGMLSVFKDGKIIPDNAVAEKAAASNANTAVEKAKKEFAYSVEYLVQREPSCKKDPLGLRAYLESIGGAVSFSDRPEDIAVTVLTNSPGKALEEGINYGQLIDIKIENLWEQDRLAAQAEQKEKAAEKAANSEVTEPESGNQDGPQHFEPAEPVNDFGFVAVAAGAGLNQMFTEIGADIVVSGGQTMNPSTEDILNAVEATPAHTVFVLPNNKNIIMAAEQVQPLTSRKVIVLPTKSVPQGISAMLCFDPDMSAADNHLAMTKAIDTVGTGQVTFAARDSVMDGVTIKEGQMLGMENGAITVVEDDLITAAYKVTKHLCGRHTEMVTIFYGEGASEEDAEKLEKMVTDKFKDVDVSVVNGGQPVYHFIISVE